MANEINLKFGASLSGGAKSVFTSLAGGLKSVAKEMKTVAKEQVALGKSGAASALNETSKSINKVAKDLTNYSKSSDQAAAATGRLSTITKQLSKSMQTYARYMVSSTILRAMTGGFGAATSAIQEHNQALHDLKAIMSATTPEVANMEKAILDVAANTKFSIGETAGAMKLLGQAGFGAGDAINALEPIANLATGTLSTLQATVNLVSTAIRVFNLETSETARVTDIYANAVNKSKLTVDKLNTAMNYIGPIANAAGMSIDETASSMMLLANAGLRASTIGTGMRRMLTLLLKPTNAFKAAVYEAGYTMDDFNPKMNKFSDIVGKLGTVVTDAESAVKMFGIRGASVIAAFAEGGQEEFERLADAVSRTGTASRMAAEQMKGLAIAIKNMKDKFGVLAVAMGKAGFTQAWSLLVDMVRALEDGLILLANSGIGQFIMSAAGMVTVIASVAAGLTLLIKIFTSKAAILFAAQIMEVTAQMLLLNVSVEAFKGATLLGSFTKLKGAMAGLKATMVGLVTSFSVLSGVIIAVVAFIGAISLGWKRYNDYLRGVIAKNEALSGSYELVLSGMDQYNRVLEKNGAESKKFIAVKERLLKTFDKFGGALQGYTQLQQGLNDQLKDETLTVGESIGIWSKKAELFKDNLVGNVGELSDEELNLKEQSEAAAEVLRDENASLEEQKIAVKVLADTIRTDLIQAYTDQADASYKLWQKSQILTNVWNGIKFAGIGILTAGWKLLGAEVDFVANKLFGMKNASETAINAIFGVGDSYAYLKRQADGGNAKAQEALTQIDNYATSTAKQLTKNINPLNLTKEKIKELTTAAAKLGENTPAKIERLTFELEKMGREAKESADSFKAAFGSDLSSGGQDALKGVLFILNESKDKVNGLSTAFQEMAESGDTSKLSGSLEALEAGLQADKISAKEVKETFAKIFEKLPSDKWETFQKAITNGSTKIQGTSKVITAAIEALTIAAFDKFGLSLGKLSVGFTDAMDGFKILSGLGTASGEQIAIAFDQASKKVKTLGDMDELISEFQKLKSDGAITGYALESSFASVQAAFKKAFKEPLKEVETARKAVLTSAKGMSKGYATEAKLISDSFSTAFSQIESDFVKLQNSINTGDLTNNQTQMRMTDAYKKFTSDSLASISKFKTESLTLLNQQSVTVVARAKKLGVDVTALEKKISTDKAAIYKTTIAKHKALMAKLVALEEDRRAKIRTLEADIAGIRSSYNDDIRDMKRGAMSSGSAYADTKAELRDINNSLNNTKTGTVEWNALLERGKTLASSLNGEVKEGDNVIVSSQKALKNSLKEKHKLYLLEVAAKKEAIKLAEDEENAAKKMQAEVLKRQKLAEKGAADLAQKVSDNLTTATTKFSESIDRLVTLLEKHAPIIDASNLLDGVNAEIDSIGTDSAGSISMDVDLKLEQAKEQIALLTADTDIPEIELKTEVVRDERWDALLLEIETMQNTGIPVGVSVKPDDLEEVKAAVLGLLEEDNVTLTMNIDGDDVVLLEDSISLIEDKDVTIEASVPVADISALEKLQKLIDSLENKEIKIHTKYTSSGTPPSSVNYQATGGPVVAPYSMKAEGGSTEDPYAQFKALQSPMIRKGSGNKDDVPTMLTKGEYVLKQSIVKKLGTRFLNSLNAGKFALKDLVSNFADGGMVSPISMMKKSLQNLDIPSISNSLGSGRKMTTAVTNDQQQSTGVMDQLKDFGIVTLDTGKEKFKTIAHKDVVGQLNAHLTLMKRFST